MSRSSPSSASPSSRTRCPIDGVDVAWSAARTDARPHRRRAAAARRRLAVGPQAAAVGVRAVHHGHRRRRHRRRRAAVGPRAGRGPRARSPPSARPSVSTASRVFATVMIAAAVILGALLCDGWLRREGMEGAEPYVLLLLSASGGVMMASANDLIVMFLGLEILSIAVYVLAAMHLRKITSQEAGVKYFVLGAFSSAFFLYGIALTYGGTGSTNLVDISEFLATHRARRHRPASWPAWPCSSSGFALQGGRRAVPLLDARRVPGRAQPERVVDGVGREGRRLRRAAPRLLPRLRHLPRSTGSRSSPSLAAAHDGRGLGAGDRADRREADARLLARSTTPASSSWPSRRRATRASQAALFYLAAYTFMVAGSFGIVTVVSRKGDIGHSLDDYRGLSRDRPGARARVRAVPVRPGGRAAHVGLLRQVLRDHRGRRGRLHLAGRHRHAHRRHRRVPLPADHRVDVHVGRGRRRAPHHPGALRRRPGPRRLRGRHARRRPLPRLAVERRQGRHPGPRPRAGRGPPSTPPPPVAP